MGNLWMHDLRYIGLELENEKSYVFSFGLKGNQALVEVTRSHPNRNISLKNIKKYFKRLF